MISSRYNFYVTNRKKLRELTLKPLQILQNPQSNKI